MNDAARRTHRPEPTHQSAVAQALLIRRTEERLLDLFKEGRIFGTVHTCIGQEWTGVAVAGALADGDFVFSNHRGHGHYIAWTDDVEGLIAEVMGKETGTCGGRGGSQHLCRDGFFSNGVQGGIVPVAAGIALARKLRGDGTIGAVFVGDGTLGEGTLYEALNIIAKWSLPLLVVLENNGYAQSTAQAETLAGDIGARAAAMGLEVARADTWAWQELLETARRSADRVRAERRPLFLQVDTYRLSPHSKGDDQRDPDEIARHWERDALAGFDTGHLDGEIRARLDAAVARAEAATVQPASALVEPHEERPCTWAPLAFAEERMVHSIRRALERGLERDERVVLIGEDIRSPYGGAFKATQGLSDRFPTRVLNTPISEAAIVGIGSGLALDGFRPIVEIMFGDFVLLAGDQIVNHAAKFRWMYNDQVTVPLIVRTPMGGGRGYGPTHSQSLEKHLLGLPGTRVLALHHRFAPALLYERLLETIDRPTLVVENKILYGQMASALAPEGWTLEASDEAFPTVRLRPGGTADVTIVAYGGQVAEAEIALRTLFEDHDLLAEVVVPQQLYPLGIAAIEESVARTQGRLVVVEEGQGFAGFGSEVIGQLVERGWGGERGTLRSRRVTARACPIPGSRPLERTALPSAESIVQAALEVVGG